MAVKLKTRDGKVYTNPKNVFIERNEKTEMFYKLVEAYQPPRPKQEERGPRSDNDVQEGLGR